jgi:ribosomal protein L7/L12
MELNKPRHFIGIIVWGYLMLMAAYSAAVFFYQEGPFWLRLLFAAICIPFSMAFGAMADKCDKKIDFDELNINWSLKVYKPISMTFLFISMAPGIGVLRVLSEDSIPDQRATPFMGAVAVFAFFSWLFGKMETTCNECDTQVRIKNATYCSKCGETLQRKTIDRPVCSKCNQPFKPNSIHCTKCGHKLVADQTANPPGHKAPPRSKATSSPCDVILQDSGNEKIKVIKEVRVFTGLGLKDAKNLVDTAPNTVLSNAPKSTAEIAKKALEAAGATITLSRSAQSGES